MLLLMYKMESKSFNSKYGKERQRNTISLNPPLSAIVTNKCATRISIIYQITVQL